MLNEYSDEQLRAELERRKKIVETAPAELTYHDFRPLIDLVREGVTAVRVSGFAPKDFEHGVFEVALEGMYGKGFWTWWDKANRG